MPGARLSIRRALSRAKPPPRESGSELSPVAGSPFEGIFEPKPGAVREESVTFFSEATRVSGLLRLPDDAPGPFSCIVQGPAWLGVKAARRNLPYHSALTAAGFAVMVFDARGSGDSDGDRTRILPENQVSDLLNAVTFLTARPEINPRAIGTFGTGATGGGNAILAAARDRRIRCVVAQVPISDGEDWLRRMRREYEWYEFKARIEEDARRRALGEDGEMVQPRGDIVPATPEREAAEKSALVEKREIADVSLATAEALLHYRPIDAAGGVRALLVIGVEDDPVTPTDHAVALYEAARPPKRLLLLPQTTHHEAYTKYEHIVVPEIVSWFTTHLAPDSSPVVTRQEDGSPIVIRQDDDP